MRAAHEAQVMPPISSSTSACAPGIGSPAGSSAGHLVAGLLDGGADGVLVDGYLAADGETATGQVDVDGGHARNLRHLLGDGADAVATGHADDGVGGGAHEGPLRIRWVGDSGTHEAGDGLGGLADLLLGLPAAGARGLDDAVAEMLLEQAEGDRLQGLRHRRDLGEDVDAVLLVLDHALQTAGLALDATEPLEVLVLAVDVAVVVLVPGAVRDGLHVVPLPREELSIAPRGTIPP